MKTSFKTYLSAILGIGLLLSLAACDVFTIKPTAQLKLNTSDQLVLRKADQFGFALFDQLLKSENAGSNVVASPLSISMAFGLALNGASGETRAEIEKALKLNLLKPEEINAAYKTLLEVLPKLDAKVQMQIANAVWYRDSFKDQIKPSFLSTNQSYFDAKVQGLDFSQTAALNTINGWVKAQTNGKITKILDKISADDVMFLMNALYFKGAWTNQFEAKQTKLMPFNLPTGKQVEASMMYKEGELKYLENEMVQAVELPYGKENYSMVVLLPKGNKTVAQVSAAMGTEWEAWMSNLRSQKIQLQLPRFKTAYEVELNSVLKSLGIQKAFVPNVADFSGISDVKLNISTVKHKTFIEVNEEGTEAAAVTSIGIVVTSMPILPVMTVDRPFIFAIREKSSGALLFMGRIANPNA